MLAEIVEHKRGEVARREAALPLELLRAQARPTRRSLATALSARRPALILEHKRLAPSGGVLRPTADLAETATAYAPFAAAVSVLTDTRYFGGSHADLASLRQRLDLPLLCKDFVVSPYQVVEARVHGADAVLLMLAVLDDRRYAECAAAAAALGMEVLCEVHDADELERALRLGARIVGINNRDLRTLAVDLETTRRLAPRLPRGVLRVAESGIATRVDLGALAPLVDALLIGSALMRAPRLDLAVRALAVGRVKICGLTRAADARAAYAAGAIYAGLNFASVSPRCITLTTAREVIKASPLRPVGVFVDAPADAVVATVRALDLAAVQLHGDEDRGYAERLRHALPLGVELWKATPVSGTVPEPAHYGVDRLVLDAPHPTLRGGTGRRFDWRALDAVRDRDRYLVAGGIGPADAAAADRLGCHAIDVCSGVEQSPGCKDPAQIAALFGSLRASPALEPDR